MGTEDLYVISHFADEETRWGRSLTSTCPKNAASSDWDRAGLADAVQRDVKCEWIPKSWLLAEAGAGGAGAARTTWRRAVNEAYDAEKVARTARLSCATGEKDVMLSLLDQH